MIYHLLPDRFYIYATILEYPLETNSVSLKFISPFVDELTTVKLLGYNGQIEVRTVCEEVFKKLN